MKKIYLLFTLSLLSSALLAQKYTINSFGYLGGQSNTRLSESDSVNFTFSGGDPLATGQFQTIQLDKAQVLVGSPAMVSYFPRVFDAELFISKGYFSDYVQLQWSIISQQDRITKIKIFRKPLGEAGDSLLIATMAPDDFSYRDEYAEKGVLYEYTLFAEGIADDLRLPFINYLDGVGFAFPFGTAAGSISYKGGTAVEGVQILAETDGKLGGKSILLNGSDAYLSVDHLAKHNELELSDGFSVQLWAQYTGTSKGTLFSKGEQYELSYEPGNLSFRVGDSTLNMAYDHPVDTFFHVTAVYDTDQGLSLHVQLNDFDHESAHADGPASLNATREPIYFGRNSGGINYFGGMIDELRVWNVSLTSNEAKSNFSRYLTGSETGLAGYWKLNSGIGAGFYDFSRKGFNVNENHGQLWRGAWSDIIPSKSQLAYRGVTDEKGNYVVTGFPYETAGSQYTFTPLFGVHSFEPVQQLRFVGDGSSIFNGLDFEDVSSFPVSGTIKYRHSYFPVEGVSILIDGNAAVDSEGGLVVSDNLGRFTVDVPIGFHSIRLSKNGHVFKEEGRFPPRENEEEIPVYDFQQPLAGLEFIDNTLVKLVGKVVGGPTEAGKPLGFGLSNNNIGIAQINLTSEKSLDITTSDSTVMYDERDIESSTRFSTKFITVYPDEVTGEYVAYVPPEKYVVTAVTAGDYTFSDDYHVSINLEQFIEQSDSNEEIVKAILKNGDEVPGYDPLDSSQYDYFTSEEILDTTYVYGGKVFTYEKVKDFILRVKPDIAVTNQGGEELFGERTYLYKDDLREDEVVLIDSEDNYTFGNPVFFQQARYNMYISVFEEYVNADDNDEVDRVPVKDGNLEIVNDFAINREAETLALDEKGKARYSFLAGLPELNKNITDSTLSFTRPFALTAITGENGTIRTTWNESSPLRGIVFGGVPEGNDFVTTGPNQIITILRDPPGSNSSASLEAGSTMSNTTTWGTEITSTTEVNATIDLGAKVITWAGIGAGIISENEVVANFELGLELETSFAAGGESVNTITNTKTWSTSDDEGFVGSPGDVFVGNSTNIVYGAAKSLQPIPVTDEECATGLCDNRVGDFQLGPRVGLRLNPEFGTMFIFSQNQIENVLIPNLIEVRNSFLSYSTDPGSVVATSEVIYLSLVSPDDERYGSANYNRSFWGDDATANIGVGPSYNILIPTSIDPNTVTDTIGYFNKQIEGWIRTLEQNERVKVEARLSENISFDGGTSFSSSESVESSSSFTFDFNVGITASMATTLGFEIFGLGTEVNTSQSLKMGGSTGTGVTTSNSTSYGYSLGDGSSSGSSADYYSIDVKTPEDGYGPVFVTRAGVTSCPFEPEERTEYFEPGDHVLNYATVQVEKPEITISNPLVANVPSNRDADINIELKNNSEDDSDVFYNLSVDDQSNFSGAILSIDGSVLTGDGRGFLVPSGSAVTKILKVSKGSDDINNYENIILTLSSQCDGNISDSQSFSVYFQPGCSDIRLTSPVDQWVVNTNTIPEKIQNITFDAYDLQNGQFRYAKFQYKASSSSQWLTSMIFYNPLLVNQTEFDGLDEPKAWLNEAGATLFPWDMNALPDRDYDVRVVSVCEIAPGQSAETPSDVHSGTKDTKRPVVFGAPQPADGILSANDEIMIQFDETIEAGLLTPFNFSVRGVLNSAEINHNTSIILDGINNYVKIGDGLNLDDKSFTIEFWLKRNDFVNEQIVYSKGYSGADIFEFGFNASNNFFINTGGQVTTSVTTYTDLGWNHYAVVFNSESNQVEVYMNDQYVLEQADITSLFTGEGSIVLGKSQATNDSYFNGNIHEFRVWSKARQIGDVYALMSKRLAGSEVGLVGYWPMEEALGSRAFDLARSRHAIVFADWEVSPKGSAYAFDGVDDYLELNTGSTIVVTPEMDYTIEFWFKGTPGQTNSVMFSSGKGDGTDVFNDPANSLSIGFDDNGLLYLINNGEKITVSKEDYLDDSWHHFAFTLLRQANANLVVDGAQKVTLSGSNFGGLSGASMWLGARGHKANAVDKEFDQHFNGYLDEFRVWNLGKKLAQVDLNKNSRLIGDEIGLIGYYPFEYYETVTGVKIMNPTIADQWINPYGANAGSATTFGGADYSDDTPNIKDARPVDKIDFDWAVNDDKIIITPSSAFTALIEQTVLEITLQNVEDLFENRLASPVTWTAFIDRNQLKWDTDKIIAKKEVYEAYTFDVDVVNLGGSETSYSIDNLPLWLEASPSEGVLSPASAQTVTFTVNEGLNTGYYLEDIYLSSDFGFDEKLAIDLQVFSPEPDWNTNAFDFQYSMNLVALLQIEGILSADENDRVAAFVNDSIRGDVNLQYVEELDLYEVFLDIFSNQNSGDTVELRVWDADKGVEYRNALPEIIFSSNEILGSPTNPDLIEAFGVTVQTLEFEPGWNWTSVNVTAPELSDINTLMRNVTAETGDQIKGIVNFDVFTEGFGWSGTLSRSGGLENGPMYLFSLSNPGLVEVVGQQADPATTIDISTGWNWLGFIPRFNMTVNEAFAFFNPTSGDIIKSQFAFAIYDENNGWLGSLNNLEPGRGYLFNSSTAGTFIYPETSFLSSGRQESSENLISDFRDIDRHKFPYNMSIIAKLEHPGNENLVLAAYHDSEMRGVMEPMTVGDGEELYFMTIYGDNEPDLLTFKAIDMETGDEQALVQTMNFAPDELVGSLSAPFRFDERDNITGTAANEAAISIYPNPFTDELVLFIPDNSIEKPEVVLTDIAGKSLGELSVLKTPTGWSSRLNTVDFHLVPGIYVISINSNGTVQSFNIVKKN